MLAENGFGVQSWPDLGHPFKMDGHQKNLAALQDLPKRDYTLGKQTQVEFM